MCAAHFGHETGPDEVREVERTAGVRDRLEVDDTDAAVVDKEQVVEPVVGVHHRGVRWYSCGIRAGVARELVTDHSRFGRETVAVSLAEPVVNHSHESVARGALFGRGAVEPRQRREERRVPQRAVQPHQFVDARTRLRWRAASDLVA